MLPERRRAPQRSRKAQEGRRYGESEAVDKRRQRRSAMALQNNTRGSALGPGCGSTTHPPLLPRWTMDEGDAVGVAVDVDVESTDAGRTWGATGLPTRIVPW